jgi:hypothetical protein
VPPIRKEKGRDARGAAGSTRPRAWDIIIILIDWDYWYRRRTDPIRGGKTQLVRWESVWPSRWIARPYYPVLVARGDTSTAVGGRCRIAAAIHIIINRVEFPALPCRFARQATMDVRAPEKYYATLWVSANANAGCFHQVVPHKAVGFACRISSYSSYVRRQIKACWCTTGRTGLVVAAWVAAAS